MLVLCFYLQVVGWKGLHKWKNAGWRRPNGRPPANLDLWIMFDAQLSGLNVRMEHVSVKHESWGNTHALRQYLRDRLIPIPVAVRVPQTRTVPTQRRRYYAREPRFDTTESTHLPPSPPLSAPLQPPPGTPQKNQLHYQQNKSFIVYPPQNRTTSITTHFALSVLVILIVFLVVLHQLFAY